MLVIKNSLYNNSVTDTKTIIPIGLTVKRKVQQYNFDGSIGLLSDFINEAYNSSNKFTW